jgi:hypothetical protein
MQVALASAFIRPQAHIEVEKFGIEGDEERFKAEVRLVRRPDCCELTPTWRFCSRATVFIPRSIEFAQTLSATVRVWQCS